MSLQMTSVFTTELISCLQTPSYDQHQARQNPPCLPAQCFIKNAIFIETQVPGCTPGREMPLDCQTSTKTLCSQPDVDQHPHISYSPTAHSAKSSQYSFKKSEIQG